MSSLWGTKRNPNSPRELTITPEARGEEMSLLKRLMCRIGWHSFFVGWDYASDYHGFNAPMKCKWCPQTGLVDSQGNLF